MQRFSNTNTFTTRHNRFSEAGPKYRTQSISNINHGNSFNSKNSESLYFTNYLNSDKQKNYKELEELYSKIMNNDISFVDNDYFCDEIYDNGKVLERLIEIINYDTSLNITKPDINCIFKLKNKQDARLHIYIKLNNSNAELILIDLYHLTMPADIMSKGRVVKRGSLAATKKAYNKFEKCSYNISNITKGVTA